MLTATTKGQKAQRDLQKKIIEKITNLTSIEAI